MNETEVPSSPLISAAQLHVLIQSSEPPTLLDVRWSLASGGSRSEYEAGHLPGAVFVDLETELAAAPGVLGRHPLPDPTDFERSMRAVGVSTASRVVCYDGGPGMSAARAWWLLRYFGHQEVYLLDGGYAEWVRSGHETSTEATIPATGDFEVAKSLAAVLAVDDVLTWSHNSLLLDARDNERYLGLVEPVDPVAGHIPGAVSVPTKGNVTADGTFRPADDLRAAFAAAGADGSAPIAVYCGSGVTAAHEIFALEVAGLRATLFPGSWSHWITDPTRPIATSER